MQLQQRQQPHNGKKNEGTNGIMRPEGIQHIANDESN